jgi:hypothetical protein
MVLALAVLAYLVYITMTGSEKFANKPMPAAKPMRKAEHMGCSINPQPVVIPQPMNMMQPIEAKVEPKVEPKVETFVAQPQIVYDAPVAQPIAQPVAQPESKIKYEQFADVGGIADTVHGAAPFGSKPVMDEGDMAKVNYTGMVDGTPGDVIQIEGTDLLTAPLVDNMLYTNSIANTNRNASQDLRGDIPLQFNDTYTPFYSSVIYGAPLSEKQMTIGRI